MMDYKLPRCKQLKLPLISTLGVRLRRRTWTRKEDVRNIECLEDRELAVPGLFMIDASAEITVKVVELSGAITEVPYPLS